MEKHAPYFREWVEHSSYDDYWNRWSIDEAYHQIKVPGIHTGGLYDIFLRGTVKNFVGLTDKQQDPMSSVVSSVLMRSMTGKSVGLTTTLRAWRTVPLTTQ